ncbi:MAG: cytochrome c [Acetobacteraceae bacterium]|nr:cytochrome c [Acetobacteraceae bacterium]
MRAGPWLVLAGLAAGPALADDSFTQMERGRYIADAGDCMPCHTAPGGKPWAGGRAIETPFGNLVSPNVTPDRETGIGAWTDNEFADALQKGVGHGGEHLYPAMPYTYYTKVTREDVLAIRAYLNTLEPVVNKVRSNQLPFPFDIRANMLAWNEMFFTQGEYKPDTGKSAEWNRGAYLVRGLGHCGGCHTSKNALGGDEDSKALQGNVLQGWFAPNITNDERTGLGKWSVDEVVQYLQTGHNSWAAASGPMAEVVQYSTSRLKTDDLHAIAVYLKDQPGQGGTATATATNAAGEAIYKDSCAACHFGNGEGQARMYPRLALGPFVQSAEPTTLIRVVLEGMRSVGTPGQPTAPAMPAYGWKLDDAEVAAVVTYVRNAWGNAASAVGADDVAKMRKELAQRGD